MGDLLAGLRDGELDEEGEEDDDEEADDDEKDLKKMAGALKSLWGAEKEKEPEKVTETDLLRKQLGKEGGPSDYEKLTGRLGREKVKKVAPSSADPLEALITNASGSQGHSSMVNLLTLQLLMKMMMKDGFAGDSQESGGRAFRRVHKT